MFFLVVFFFCFNIQLAFGMDNNAEPQPLLFSNDLIVFEGHSVGFLNKREKQWEPLNKIYQKKGILLNLNDEEIKAIEVGYLQEIELNGKKVSICVCPSTSFFEIAKFLKQLSFDKKAKNYITTMLDAAQNFDKYMNNELGQNIMPLVRTVMTEVCCCNNDQKKRKMAICNFLKDFKKVCDTSFIKFSRKNRPNYFIGAEATVLLMVFLIVSYKKNIIFTEPRYMLAILGYVSFMTIEFAGDPILYLAHKKYTDAYTKLVNDIGKS